MSVYVRSIYTYVSNIAAKLALPIYVHDERGRLKYVYTYVAHMEHGRFKALFEHMRVIAFLMLQ